MTKNLKRLSMGNDKARKTFYTRYQISRILRQFGVEAVPVAETEVLQHLIVQQPGSAEVIYKAANEMRVTPDELRVVVAGLVDKANRCGPLDIRFLLAVALVPVIAERGLVYFRKRGFSPQDSEDLSQNLARKTLVALTKKWPRGNLGAWLAKVLERLCIDEFRKRGRRARAMQRLEEAFLCMRK